MSNLTDCEYVYDAFDNRTHIGINWKDLHGKLMRVFVSHERAIDVDAEVIMVGLYDEQTNKKYYFRQDVIPGSKANAGS